ncbi:MAG TPA: hypothetical protein VHC67_04820 [Gaiellaceae bacterium]|jgi:hypothetical protein|nr:hypothetical protein [Gaiellaceae bacterium]
MAVARRCELVRIQNARIAASARTHHFDSHSPVPFVCECEDADCREFVTLTLPEYDGYRAHALYLVSLDHPFPGGERIAGGDGFAGYRLLRRVAG